MRTNKPRKQSKIIITTCFIIIIIIMGYYSLSFASLGQHLSSVSFTPFNKSSH